MARPRRRLRNALRNRDPAARPPRGMSLTRFGGQVVKALSPSASVPRLFLFRSSSRLWELWNRSSIVSTAPAASMFLTRDQRACLKYKYVLGCRLFLVALKIIGATISQRRVETL